MSLWLCCPEPHSRCVSVWMSGASAWSRTCWSQESLRLPARTSSKPSWTFHRWTWTTARRRSPVCPSSPSISSKNCWSKHQSEFLCLETHKAAFQKFRCRFRSLMRERERDTLRPHEKETLRGTRDNGNVIINHYCIQVKKRKGKQMSTRMPVITAAGLKYKSSVSCWD